MAKPKKVLATTALAKLIFSNIMRQQYLQDVSDAQLCSLLDVTPRTLTNYRNDPSAMTVKQLQAIVEGFGLEPETLFRT